MLHDPLKCKSNSAPTVTGYALALSKAPAWERAFVPARLVLGQLGLIEPRVSQASRLACVSEPYVDAAIAVLRSGNLDHESAVDRGELTLLEAAVLAKHPPRNLTEQFLTATSRELADLGRYAGPTMVWDELIVPNLL